MSQLYPCFRNAFLLKAKAVQLYLLNNVVEIFHSKYYLVFIVTADSDVAKILLNMLKMYPGGLCYVLALFFQHA